MVYQRRHQSRDVRWYHGATGTGKTKAVFDEFTNAYAVPSDIFGISWDGYQGQPLLIDDFRPEHTVDLLYILASTTIPEGFKIIPTRGGQKKEVTSNVLIITSLHPPAHPFIHLMKEIKYFQ